MVLEKKTEWLVSNMDVLISPLGSWIKIKYSSGSPVLFNLGLCSTVCGVGEQTKASHDT